MSDQAEQKPTPPTLADRDRAEGRWRGVYFYMHHDWARRLGKCPCSGRTADELE